MNKVKVSIIVTIYNAADYLRECLESLVSQTLKEIEVFMINDGSTDESKKIAEEYAVNYENFYIVNKEHGGNGQCKNYGVSFAKGEYIAFLNSNDYVANETYEKLYAMTNDGTVDIVTGNVVKIDEKGEDSSFLHNRVFKESVEDTHITKNPSLIYDTFIGNKIFRKEFWDKNNIKFIEHIVEEDLPVIIPAFFNANSTAILSDDVYYWRAEKNSLIGEKMNISEFIDRLYAIEVVDKFITDNVKDGTCTYIKNNRWINVDFMSYINRLDEVRPQNRGMFVNIIKEYIKEMPNSLFDDLKAIDRIKYYCIKNNELDTLMEVINFEKNNIASLEVIRKGNKYIGKFPFKGIPKEYYDMTIELNRAEEVKKISKITYEDGVMNLKGYVYIPRVNLDKSEIVKMSAYLINTKNGKKAEVKIINEKKPMITQNYGVRAKDYKLNNRLFNYDWCGYSINIDFNKKEIMALGSGKYNIIINLKVPGIDKDIVLGNPCKGKGATPKPYLWNLNKLLVKYDEDGNLIISSTKQFAGITACSFKDDSVILEGWFSDKDYDKKLLIINWKTGVQFPIYAEENKEYTISPTILKKHPNAEGFKVILNKERVMKTWGVGSWFFYYFRNGKRRPLTGVNILNKRKAIDNINLVRLDISLSGATILRNTKLSTYLDNININDENIRFATVLNKGELNIKGSISKVAIRCVTKKSDEDVVIPGEIIFSGKDILKAIFNLKLVDNKGRNLLTANDWKIYIDYESNEEKVSDELYTLENQEYDVINTDNHKYTLNISNKGVLGIKSKLVWSWIDKGPRRREALERYVYPALRLLPLNKKTVVFSEQAISNDDTSPKSLYEYIDKYCPQYKCVWTVKDESEKVAGGAEKVRIGSVKYLYYMATSKFMVNNLSLPEFYEKRKRTIEINTVDRSNISLDNQSREYNKSTEMFFINEVFNKASR